VVDSSWNVMAHGDAREGIWRGNWRMVWVASTLHTTSEHGVSSITTAYAHTSAASSPLNWRPRRFKWTRLFSRKKKSGFCTCAITFQLASSVLLTRTDREEQHQSHGAGQDIEQRLRHCSRWWRGLQDAWMAILMSKFSDSNNGHNWSHHLEMKMFLGMLSVLANLFYCRHGD
jgi:hypothetical protein